jgi:hypothetical protein
MLRLEAGGAEEAGEVGAAGEVNYKTLPYLLPIAYCLTNDK